MDPDEDGPVLLHLLEVKDAAGSPALSNPEAVKGKAFETLRQLTVKGSQRRPLILVLEDLHWVDKISEEFLGFLAENVRDARVLLLATYRPAIGPLGSTNPMRARPRCSRCRATTASRWSARSSGPSI